MTDDERRIYLSLVQEYSEKYGASILAYCLMTNHVHLIVVPRDHRTLARLFNICHMTFAKLINKKHQATGHVWHSRYYSCVMQLQHLLNAACYIERNPVRAGIVDKPWNWKWSSAAFHIGKSRAGIISGNLFEYIGVTAGEWVNLLCKSDDRDFQNYLQEQTRTGRPAGEPSFITELEALTSRHFQRARQGRYGLVASCPRFPSEKLVSCPPYEAARGLWMA